LLHCALAYLHSVNEEETWEAATALVLDKCCTQAFYVDMYVRFLRDLLKCAAEDNVLHHDVNGRIEKFVKTFIEESFPRASYIVRAAEEYYPLDGDDINDERKKNDIFCEEIKRRNRIIGSGKTVIRLFGRSNVEDVAQYLESLRSNIADAGDDLQLDILLEILIDAIVYLGGVSSVSSTSGRRLPRSAGGAAPISSTASAGDEHRRQLNACAEVARSRYDDSNTKCRFRILDICEMMSP